MIEATSRGMRASVVVVIGFLIAGLGITSASATTSQHSSTPLCVPIEGTPYQPAVGEPTIQVSNHDFVQAVDEVSHLEFQYKKYVWDWNHGYFDHRDSRVGDTDYGQWDYVHHSTTDFTDEVKSADPFKFGDDWYKWSIFATHTVITTPAVAGHPETFSTVANPDYVPEVPAVQAVTCPDPTPTIVTSWYTWNTGTWTPDAHSAGDVHWPQTLVGQGQIAPTACETTYQQDKYVGTQDQIDAVIGDSQLTFAGQPEDHAIVKEWHFVSTKACPPPQLTTVIPKVLRTDPCGPDNATVTGVPDDGIIWTTNDDGSITATAAEHYTLGDSQTTFSPQDSGTLCPPELKLVVPQVLRTDPCGPDNATVTGVPDDGIIWTTNDDGTITATAAEHYTLGEAQTTFGPQDSGVACPVVVTPKEPTVIDPPTCGPNNDVLYIPTTDGVSYSDTGWVGGERTITATAQAGYTLTGTTSWTFHDAATTCPVQVSAVQASVVGPPTCGPDDDVLAIPTTIGVTYSDTGWVNEVRTITATAQQGYTLVGTKSWTFHDADTTCPVVLKQADLMPTVVPICFPDNDLVTLPAVQGVTYTDSGWHEGKRTITAHSGEGYVLVGDATWTFTDVPSTACPPQVTGFAGNEGGALAGTGVPSSTNGLVGLALLLVIGGTALVIRRVREH